jgi:hypothetical protein
MKRGISEPLILSESNIRSILNKERSIWKEYFFAAIRPAQKWESRGFQETQDNVFEPIYFLLRRVCQTRALARSLKAIYQGGVCS